MGLLSKRSGQRGEEQIPSGLFGGEHTHTHARIAEWEGALCISPGGLGSLEACKGAPG